MSTKRKIEEMAIDIDINTIFKKIERCMLNDIYADNDTSMNNKTLNELSHRD